MLDKINLKATLGKNEYQDRMDVLVKRLARIQVKLIDLKIPVVILFDGWSAAGKGTLISSALAALDPRHFKVHSMEKVTEEQFHRPFLWSYAVRMPAAGKIAIFDKSYYMALVPDSGMIRKFKKDNSGVYYDIRSFEQQLLDGGNIVLKYFIHISREEQSRRFKELTRSDDTRWRVTEKDTEQNAEYAKNYKLFNEIFENSKDCPAKWTLLNGTDKRIAALEFYEHITDRLTQEIKMKEAGINKRDRIGFNSVEKIPDILGAVDLTKNISDERYSRLMKQYQQQVSVQVYKLYKHRRSVVIVYEGWDASGKGGNIKRLTQEMDPRGYDVNPVAAPTAQELSQHYLWRFWKGMPKDGHMTIFDRSWYGRVLVERVEGFCSEDDWRGAYQEINDMEQHLHRHGVMIIKFWLHISRDEQLARFKARMEEPSKQHKICDEDWRNREKWDEYYVAINEMLHKTSTSYAPWLIVESESKKFARIKVLEHVSKILSKEL